MIKIRERTGNKLFFLIKNRKHDASSCSLVTVLSLRGNANKLGMRLGYGAHSQREHSDRLRGIKKKGPCRFLKLETQ